MTPLPRRLRALIFTALSLIAVLGVTLGFAALAGYRVLRVASDEMAPSIQPGDWLLLGPGEPVRGDVVRLLDPLDPGRSVLRRVLAEPGESIGFTGHQPRLDGQAMKHVVMGDDDGEMILMESSAWLLAVSLETTRQRLEAQQVPPGHHFLVADHRDVALDSRHWGPASITELEKVHLRAGPSDVWRAMFFRPRQTVRPEIPLLPYQVPEELKGKLGPS
jgi:signal peptidase I